MTVANPYTSVSVSGFNASPPSDDGSQVAANRITWSGILGKIGTPLNTFAAAVDAAILGAFGALAPDIVAPSDQDELIVAANHHFGN